MDEASCDVVIRTSSANDASFLREAFYVALWDPPDQPRRPRSSLDEPRIAALITDWGRVDDVGFVAEERATGKPIGAVWVRQYSPPPIGREFVDDRIPHLGIAVLDAYQGRGIGIALMERVLEAAKAKFGGIALSVHPKNPARRLYERFGFRLLGEVQSGYLLMCRQLMSSKNGDGSSPCHRMTLA